MDTNPTTPTNTGQPTPTQTLPHQPLNQPEINQAYPQEISPEKLTTQQPPAQQPTQPQQTTPPQQYPAQQPYYYPQQQYSPQQPYQPTQQQYYQQYYSQQAELEALPSKSSSSIKSLIIPLIFLVILMGGAFYIYKKLFLIEEYSITKIEPVEITSSGEIKNKTPNEGSLPPQ